jgi:parvulin-like peptidyl-prolyl isomerase
MIVPKSIKSTFSLAWVAAAALATAGAASDDKTVLARVGGTDVTVGEIRAALGALDARQREQLERAPALLNQAGRALLVQRLLVEEALGKRWDQEAAVKDLIERARKNVIAESYLQSVAKPPSDFPAEADIKAVYEANRAALQVPRQHRIAQVYVALPKGADAAAEEKAGAKLAAVKKALAQPGADFAAVAKAQSDEASSAERGGEVGWLTEDRLQPGIREVVKGMAKGAVSEPVRLEDGWHILKCLDLREARTAEFAEVKEQLAQQMRAERARAAGQAYVDGLLGRNNVAINEIALSGLVKPRGE